MNQHLGPRLLYRFHVGPNGRDLGFVGHFGHGLVHVFEMFQYLEVIGRVDEVGL